MEKIVLYRILAELSKHGFDMCDASYIIHTVDGVSSWMESKDFVSALDCTYEQLVEKEPYKTKPASFSLLSDKMVLVYQVKENSLFSTKIPPLVED